MGGIEIFSVDKADRDTWIGNYGEYPAKQYFQANKYLKIKSTLSLIVNALNTIFVAACTQPCIYRQ